ncbi:MAG: hypothetical protein ACLFVS_04780 [Candidatus Acetothermia bacterium]|nr:hypothetical protein [Candidatus Bipolaricaulota bacterium]
MTRRTCVTITVSLTVIILAVVAVQMPMLAQENDDNGQTGVLNRLLTYLDTLAVGIGSFIVFIVKEISGVKLSSMARPLGYLGEMTILLLAIELLEGAKKVFWFLVVLGWGLIAIRVALEILNVSQV